MHIAIFGCGQLAQMMAKAGQLLGFTFVFVAESGEDTRCVSDLGAIVRYAPEMTAEALFKQLGQPDVITVEKEMVDAPLLKGLGEFTAVYPDDRAVRVAQNRIREKTFLRKLGIPTAEFEIIQSLEQLLSLPERLGFPIYIKAAESGYDGYHQWRITEASQLNQPELLAALEKDVELIAEKHVDYQREISVIAARNVQGEIAVYPIMENIHHDGVLIATVAPAPEIELSVQQSANDAIKTLLVELNYVGILTMECFETREGIVANELAPRVHNSGHWTIEGSATSQFSNHCRAIAGLELGPTHMEQLAGLVNMLGEHGNPAEFDEPHVFYHAYGKEERPRRKLGHISVCADNLKDLKQSLNHVMTTLYANRYPLL